MKLKKFGCLLLMIATLLPGFFSFPLSARAESSLDEAQRILAQAAMNHESTVDLSSLSLPVDQIQALTDSLFETYPELFHLERSLSYSYSDTDAPTIMEVSLNYRMNAAEYAAAMEQIDSAVGRLTQDLSYAYTNVQKLLLIHDRILLNYQYDTTLASTDAHSFFTQGKGTCNAYSMAFMMICRQLGVEAKLVISEEMNHAWVRVKLDGDWFHVDLTADDPIPDRKGRADHRYFLVSDRRLKSEGYTDFEEGFCQSTRYDYADWKNASSPIVFYDGNWYYINAKNSTLYKLAFLESSPVAIHTIDSVWSSGTQGAYWEGCFSSLVLCDDLLYFNTADQIVSLQPYTSVLTTVFSPQLNPGESIYGLWLGGDKRICYSIHTDPNTSELAVREYDIPSLKQYTVMFISDGKLFRSVTVSPGASITVPSAIPTKAPTSKGRYEFIGWSGYTNGMRANSNMIFHAQFTFVPGVTATKAPTVSSTSQQPLPPASTSVPSSSSEPLQSDPPTSSSVPEWTAGASASITIIWASSSVPHESLPSGSYHPDAHPSHSHNFPQVTTQGAGSVAPSATANAPEQSKDPNQGKQNPAVPWIFAITGSVIVVGLMVLRERVLLPKKKAKNAPPADTKSADSLPAEEKNAELEENKTDE